MWFPYVSQKINGWNATLEAMVLVTVIIWKRSLGVMGNLEDKNCAKEHSIPLSLDDSISVPMLEFRFYFTSKEAVPL